MPPFRGGGMGVYHPRAFSSPSHSARGLAPARLSHGSMSPTRLFQHSCLRAEPASGSPRDVIVLRLRKTAKTLLLPAKLPLSTCLL
jgi:hypothetical protein